MLDRLKRTAQAALKSLGLYHRIKSSVAYDLYWRLANPALLAGRDEEVAFFRRLLGGFQANDLVFDIGANQGHKTDIFLRLGARVIAVDPDAANGRILRESLLQNRLRKKPVMVVTKAVSDRNGIETMWVDKPGSAKNTLNSKWVETLQSDAARFGQTLEFENKVEVETVTLDELIRLYGQPFYIKIDVEGHEPGVLRGLSTSVPFVSFEVNLPEFLPEALQCVDLLHALDPLGEFNYAVECRGEMACDQWLKARSFPDVLRACHEPSIEVFWRKPTAA